MISELAQYDPLQLPSCGKPSPYGIPLPVEQLRRRSESTQGIRSSAAGPCHPVARVDLLQITFICDQMHLILSRSSPLNAVYSNEQGQAIYEVHSPFKLVNRTSTISRILPGDTSTQVAHLAQIDWKVFNPSWIRFGLVDMDVKTYFREGKWGPFGRDRIFTAPDGREYKWVLGSLVSQLYLNDEAKTPVARFHRRRIGIFRKGRKASLEIFPPGEDIVDIILVTFVYVEKLRKVREETARHMAGG